ncbi:Lon protease1, mitochondrial [Sesamum angolense]|uniref:Lon protease1, mitochondrial n=1 Tax=Sesamum angolense TaxID=2727404 RepID=A0AAE1T7S5_9LAMI|nr:Lon protease1, mitochondrial [Sesamum angolense]
MLKALTRCSSRVPLGAHLRGYVPAREPVSPLLRVPRGHNRSPYLFRRFFCSDSTDGSDPVDPAGSEIKRVEAGEETPESKSSSAIVPTVVKPEDCLTVQKFSPQLSMLFCQDHLVFLVTTSKMYSSRAEVSEKHNRSLLWSKSSAPQLSMLFCQDHLVFLVTTSKMYSSRAEVSEKHNRSLLWLLHCHCTQTIVSWILYANICQGSKIVSSLVESRKRQAPYTGAFLLKDEEGTEGSDAEKNVYDLKGKDLLNRLHEVGTLAQITSIQGDQVVLIGHRRLRITEMVSEDPLTVKVDHLKEKPYDKDDDILKATSFEVISTLRDVLKTSPLWRDHAQTYTQLSKDPTLYHIGEGGAWGGSVRKAIQRAVRWHIGDFTYPRVADFGAAISGANKLQCQQVLEELDVHKRLKLTLELVKKEMEISKIQESIAKAIEEKISGEQRRYLLNEQLKAIRRHAI